MNNDLTRSYYSQIEKGVLRFDSKQEAALKALSRLCEGLLSVKGRQRNKALSSSRRLLFPKRRESLFDLPGLYLFGGVGRGKTMLMDMFFSSVKSSRKRRAHFHTFMIEVHQWMHNWRQNIKAGDSSSDPIQLLVGELATEIDLLCFDEFEIHDVADALIIRRIFSSLLDHKVVIVTTSNRPPEELYLGGLQRELFVPFISYLKEHLELIPLGDGIDYRLVGLKNKAIYFSPLNNKTSYELEAAFRSLTGGVDGMPEDITVGGRRLRIGRVNRGIAWLTFDEVCREALGASDYKALVVNFHTLVISDIPIMLPEHMNEARRFSVLIDILYDHNVKFLCSAAASPEKLYVRGTGSREFLRTVSRLREMQTEVYLSSA